MLHPVFTTLIQRPELVVEHISAYSALLHQEATEAGSQLVKRYVAWAVVAVCGLLFLIFAGIGLMLGVLHQFHWILLAVPLGTLVLMLLAIARAKAPLTEVRFAGLKAQVDSDIQALKSVS